MTVGLTGTSSPRLLARIAGLFYVLMAVFGEGATLARRGLIVSGDATTTAINIQAHQSLYLLAYAGDILMVASYVVVTALFYRLFKPVNKSVALTAAAVGLMGCAVLAIAYSYELAPLTLLGDARYLGAFTVEQRQSLSYVFLKFWSQTYGVSLVFFGLYLLLTGWLIYRSTFLPRILGVFLMLGVTALAFLSPPFATKYFSLIITGSVGEALLTIWLLVKGVDSDKWLRQVIVATGRLSSNITRVRSDEGKISVTDGPFIEGKELIPGFTIIRTDTRQEAVDWVARYREMMGMPELRIAEIFA